MLKDLRIQAVLDVGQRGQVAALAGVDVVKGVHKGRQLAGLGCGSAIQRQSKSRQSSLCKVTQYGQRTAFGHSNTVPIWMPSFGNVGTHKNTWCTKSKHYLPSLIQEVAADGINSRKVVTVESPAPGALGGRLFTAVTKSFVWVL